MGVSGGRSIGLYPESAGGKRSGNRQDARERSTECATCERREGGFPASYLDSGGDGGELIVDVGGADHKTAATSLGRGRRKGYRGQISHFVRNDGRSLSRMDGVRGARLRAPRDADRDASRAKTAPNGPQCSQPHVCGVGYAPGASTWTGERGRGRPRDARRRECRSRTGSREISPRRAPPPRGRRPR